MVQSVAASQYVAWASQCHSALWESHSLSQNDHVLSASSSCALCHANAMAHALLLDNHAIVCSSKRHLRLKRRMGLMHWRYTTVCALYSRQNCVTGQSWKR